MNYPLYEAKHYTKERALVGCVDEAKTLTEIRKNAKKQIDELIGKGYDHGVTVITYWPDDFNGEDVEIIEMINGYHCTAKL